jgi:hypothetical protein
MLREANSALRGRSPSSRPALPRSSSTRRMSRLIFADPRHNPRCAHALKQSHYYGESTGDWPCAPPDERGSLLSCVAHDRWALRTRRHHVHTQLIPECGSSAWRWAFRHGGVRANSIPREPYYNASSQASRDAAQRSFVFVREPFERLLSAYSTIGAVSGMNPTALVLAALASC